MPAISSRKSLRLSEEEAADAPTSLRPEVKIHRRPMTRWLGFGNSSKRQSLDENLYRKTHPKDPRFLRYHRHYRQGSRRHRKRKYSAGANDDLRLRFHRRADDYRERVRTGSGPKGIRRKAHPFGPKISSRRALISSVRRDEPFDEFL